MDKTGLDNKIDSMMMLIDKLSTALNELQREKEPSRNELFMFAAEKKAEEIIELATSINQVLLRTKNKVSVSYHESFTQLSIFNVFTEKELSILASTAGFRNRLAHEYLTVDSKIAVKTMQNMLLIYPLYLKKVKKIMSIL